MFKFSECIDSNGSAFGHSYSLRDCIAEIDSEIEKASVILRRNCEGNVILTGSCLDNWCDSEAARFFPNNAEMIVLDGTGEETGK